MFESIRRGTLKGTIGKKLAAIESLMNDNGGTLNEKSLEGIVKTTIGQKKLACQVATEVLDRHFEATFNRALKAVREGNPEKFSKLHGGSILLAQKTLDDIALHGKNLKTKILAALDKMKVGERHHARTAWNNALSPYVKRLRIEETKE